VRAYLDTSAWSALHDAHVSKARLADREILFSSCNLDEFVLASPHRARELARYAWSVSNGKKLLDHLELSAKEVTAHRKDAALADFHDHADPWFFDAWAAIRTAGLTHDMRSQMEARVEHAKLLFRDWLGGVRARFKPWFDLARDEEPLVAWERHLQELEKEGYIGEMLEGILRAEGLGAEFDRDIPYRRLPATACWVQYYLALSFLAAHASRKTGRPETGDQADYRHACYAGIADVFVAGDVRMRHILNEMVRDKRATIMSPDEFVTMLRAR
jgi:hypothetical protein